MSALAFKAAKIKKKARAKQLSDACISPAGEFRAMTPVEQTEFDGLIVEIKAIDAQIEVALTLEDEPVHRSANPGTGFTGRVSAPMDPADAPVVHTEEHRYSILRAMRLQLENRQVDGLEGEVSQELAKSTERKAQGFLMPLGNEPELRGLLKATYKAEYRTDLTTSTGTGAIFTSPMLPFIELLRSRIVLKQMGATFLTGMDGKFSIPRQTTAASYGWIAEGISLTPANQALDQVAFIQKTLGAATNISRKFIYQSSLDAEQFVMADLAKQLAIAFDYAGINGSGSGATPLGILQNSTVQTNSTGLALGANGAAPTFASIVSMETQVSAFNADQGSMAYLTCPQVKGTLKQTPKVGSTYPFFVWEDGPQAPAAGEMNGYPAWTTNLVPSTLSKGSSTGTLGAILFGYWADLVLAQWGGIDVVVNPYSNQLSGAITISMLTEADVEVRHPESFAIITDSTYLAY
jgi:HK97 family phage major capsid protein